MLNGAKKEELEERVGHMLGIGKSEGFQGSRLYPFGHAVFVQVPNLFKVDGIGF